MKKTLYLVLSFILLLTITSCNTNRSTSCECKLNIASSKHIQNIITDFNKNLISLPLQNTTKPVQNEIIDNLDGESDDKSEIRLYNKAKNLYLNGEWDGTPITFGSKTVSLSTTDGCLLVDGYLVSNYQKSLDLPDPFNDIVSSNFEYIPGQGMYAIQDKTLVKYVRGKKVTLGRNSSLDWKGLDPQNPDEYGCTIVDYKLYLPDSKNKNDYEYCLRYTPYLYYVPESDDLLLITVDPISDSLYMYIFPDYNVSEIKYLETISDFSVMYDGRKNTFYYWDTEGTEWIYTKNGPQKVSE